MEGVTPNKVLESLMHDGTFDAMREKLTHELKHNVCKRKPCLIIQASESAQLFLLVVTTTKHCVDVWVVKEELKNFTTSLVESSRALNAPGAEQKSRRELFDALRKELESQVLERASKEAWQLILSKDGFGKEIAQNVDKMYCELSGLEPSSHTRDINALQ